MFWLQAVDGRGASVSWQMQVSQDALPEPLAEPATMDEQQEAAINSVELLSVTT